MTTKNSRIPSDSDKKNIQSTASKKILIEKFSKSSNDIQNESKGIIESEKERYKNQKEISRSLKSFPKRKNCNCCGESLGGEIFMRRKLSFIECAVCGHIQTMNMPPSDYPSRFTKTSTFSETYPQLSVSEYLDRQNRIYKPKLDWVFSSLIKLGFNEIELARKKWIEIGSGAGYFLSALRERGTCNIVGLEKDKQLYLDSVKHNSDVEIHNWNETFDKAIEIHNADIFCSFFVLEHIDNLPQVWKKIREKPKGTLFVFSVPVFGLSCIFEEVFNEQYARNLDGVIHTQLFTDQSIKYAINLAGCSIISEWIFGQDVSDLLRFLRNNKDTKIHAKLNTKLNAIHDDIQASFDHARLSDQRHFIAVRE